MKFSVALMVICCATLLHADDWPQWMGPQRDNIWRETNLIDRFPEGGPKVVWRSPIAGGYAGPAVANGRLFVTDFTREGTAPGDNFERKASRGTERVLCLDATTGKPVWQHSYPVTYTISYPAGPRCTPLVKDGKVYTLGAEGDLFCFDVESGKVIWSKDLKKEYGTTAPLWGYSAHPLIDGQKLITLAGGKGSQVVALNKDTGEELWRSLNTPEAGQGYVPPSIIEVEGRRQLVVMTPESLNALDPETGDALWNVPYGADNGSIIMTPVRSGDYLFAGGFRDRNLLAKLTATPPKAETVWRDKPRHGLAPVNVQPFVIDDILYGFDGNGELMAIQLPSGERLWETPAPVSRRPVSTGTAFLVRQGEIGTRFWLFNENGEIIIANLTSEGYSEVDRAKVIAPTGSAFNRDVVWCMPAFANGRMYVRNDQECICVELRAE